MELKDEPAGALGIHSPQSGLLQFYSSPSWGGWGGMGLEGPVEKGLITCEGGVAQWLE